MSNNNIWTNLVKSSPKKDSNTTNISKIQPKGFKPTSVQESFIPINSTYSLDDTDKE